MVALGPETAVLYHPNRQIFNIYRDGLHSAARRRRMHARFSTDQTCDGGALDSCVYCITYIHMKYDLQTADPPFFKKSRSGGPLAFSALSMQTDQCERARCMPTRPANPQIRDVRSIPNPEKDAHPRAAADPRKTLIRRCDTTRQKTGNKQIAASLAVKGVKTQLSLLIPSSPFSPLKKHAYGCVELWVEVVDRNGQHGQARRFRQEVPKNIEEAGDTQKNKKPKQRPC